MSCSLWNWTEDCEQNSRCCGDCDHCKNFWEEDDVDIHNTAEADHEKE